MKDNEAYRIANMLCKKYSRKIEQVEELKNKSYIKSNSITKFQKNSSTTNHYEKGMIKDINTLQKLKDVDEFVNLIEDIKKVYPEEGEFLELRVIYGYSIKNIVLIMEGDYNEKYRKRVYRTRDKALQYLGEFYLRKVNTNDNSRNERY